MAGAEAQQAGRAVLAGGKHHLRSIDAVDIVNANASANSQHARYQKMAVNAHAVATIGSVGTIIYVGVRIDLDSACLHCAAYIQFSAGASGADADVAGGGVEIGGVCGAADIGGMAGGAHAEAVGIEALGAADGDEVGPFVGVGCWGEEPDSKENGGFYGRQHGLPRPCAVRAAASAAAGGRTPRNDGPHVWGLFVRRLLAIGPTPFPLKTATKGGRGVDNH